MEKKSIVIVATGFAIIILALIVWFILYLTTDLFKSNSQMFQKYFAQNINEINSVLDFSKEQNYLDVLSQKNYKDNINVKISYKNSQERLEEFNVNTQGIINNESKNIYRKINVNYGENDNILNAEYLQENQMYGVLFPTVVKQFASLEVTDLNLALSKLNINKSEIEKYNITEIWNILQNDKEKIEKVLVDFAQELSNTQFFKQKNKSIELSNKETKNVSLYSLTLSSEQTRKLVLNILKELSKQEIIDEINNTNKEFSESNITVYVSNDKIVRTAIEYENTQLKIDFYDRELNIEYANIASDNVSKININIKNNDEKKYIQYQDSSNNNLKLELGENQENNIQSINAQIIFNNQYIKQLDIAIQQKIQISENFIEISKKFENVPNVILSKLNVTGINKALDSLLQKIDTKIREKNNNINSELLNIWLQQNKVLETGYQGQKEKERNSFNNQFNSYKGQNVEKNLIYNMLDVVSNNLLKYEQVGEDKIVIYIKQRTANKEMAQEIKTLIEKNNENFDISFQYDTEGRINVIVLEKTQKENN